MKTCISGSYFNRACSVALMLGIGLALAGYAAASQAAQPGVDDFASGTNVLLIPPAYSISGNAQSYDPGTNSRVPDRFGFGKLPPFPAYLNLQKVASWMASIRLHMTEQNSSASFLPPLRAEPRENFISISPLNRSITMEWHKKLD